MTTRRTQTGIAPLWLVPIALLAMPFVEFSAFYWVAARIGLFPALVALIATSFIGASLLRRLGGSAMSRLMAAFRRGEPPEGPARESFMVALGGILMILPGFVTDVIGFALILPALLRRLREGSSVSMRRAERPPASRADPNGKVIDLGEGEWRQVGDPPR
jgi:UPF0716 protein FxsA